MVTVFTQSKRTYFLHERSTLAAIYFEENPEERLHSEECSCYWMLLEYYRLQLQYPHLEVSKAEDRNLLLSHIRTCMVSPVSLGFCIFRKLTGKVGNRGVFAWVFPPSYQELGSRESEFPRTKKKVSGIGVPSTPLPPLSRG